MTEAEREVKDLSFEEAFGELEALVQQLEDGNLPLEDNIRLFERGSLLARHCQSLLDQAELRVQQLTEDAVGRPRLTPFESQD